MVIIETDDQIAIKDLVIIKTDDPVKKNQTEIKIKWIIYNYIIRVNNT